MSFDKPVASGEPAIAIVVMSYRRADLIGETIDSLMAQSNLDRACAAVYLADDCSPDHTVEIAKRHWTSPLPLRMLAPSHNSGTWGNVNQAIARLAVDFDWVLLLHDDDLVKPHWAEEMRAAILAAPDDVGSICSSWDVLEPDGTITVGEDNPAREREHVRGTDDAVRRTLRIGCWWHFSGCAIRTSAFLDIGTFDPRYRQCGDEEWLIRGLARGWGAIYIPRTLLVYRQHVGSLSTKSLQVHQDLRERLWLLRRFGGLLPAAHSIGLHGRILQYLARRLARATVQAQWTAGVNALSLTPTVAASLVRTLVGKQRNLKADIS